MNNIFGSDSSFALIKEAAILAASEISTTNFEFQALGRAKDIGELLAFISDKTEWAIEKFLTPETMAMIGVEALSESGIYAPVPGVPSYKHMVQVEAGRRRVNILPGARAEISVWGAATANVYTFGDAQAKVLSFCGSDTWIHAKDSSHIISRSYEKSNTVVETAGHSRSVVFADEASRVKVLVLSDSSSEIVAVADSTLTVETWGRSETFISCGGASCLRLETWRDSRVDVSLNGAALGTVDAYDKSRTVVTCSEGALATTLNRPGCDFQAFATGRGVVRDLTANAITVPEMGLFLIKK